MRYSQFTAKLVVRLFFILLLIALVPFLQGDNSKLKHLYLMPQHVWALAFPVLLMTGFIALLVICSVKKYTHPDLNWLLVINTIVLMAYAVTIYIRINQIAR